MWSAGPTPGYVKRLDISDSLRLLLPIDYFSHIHLYVLTPPYCGAPLQVARDNMSPNFIIFPEPVEEKAVRNDIMNYHDK